MNSPIDNDPTTPSESGPEGEERRLISRTNVRRQSDRRLNDVKASVLIREHMVIDRESAADIREELSTTREHILRETELLQETAREDSRRLQQANEKLIIAAIEAQSLSEQLQFTQTQMEIAKTEAEKANLAKSRFLSSMSHELRTPLNAILGFAQLLETGASTLSASQQSWLKQILKSGWYLLDLINEILDLSLIESSKLAISNESLSLIDVILDCQAVFEPKLQQRNIKLTILPFNENSFVFADRRRVKQALINLLSNAIKYNSEPGSIEIKLTTTSLNRLRISIKDTGLGLSEEQLSKLFQPFVRLGQENSDVEGTGIGLVVTKHLVELMGGTIGVISHVGQGSEFWIELIRDDASQLINSHDVLYECISHNENKEIIRTLLYVEDNPASLMLVEQIIQSHPQLRLLCARDGYLGIALARTHLPDIILLDINLPGLSGNHVMKMLRLDPVTAHIPIVALSANAQPDAMAKGLTSGFFSYISKPIKINELMNTINEALALAANKVDQ